MPRAPLVLVTGATDGIGRETARQVAARGAREIVHGRSAARAEAVRASLPGEHPPVAIADFSSLAAVRAMGETLAAGEPIDVLLNNAGIYAPRLETSAEGLELTAAVNYFAPFLLTHLLLDRVAASELRRIVNVSSMTHFGAHLDPDTYGEPPARYDAYAAYAASKLANVLFTVELARRVADRGVTVNALHPGVVGTKLLHAGFGGMGGASPSAGARTSVMLALDADVAGVTGRYYDAGRQAAMNPLAGDRAVTSHFYEVTSRRVGLQR